MSAPDRALHQSRKFFLRQNGRPHMSQKSVAKQKHFAISFATNLALSLPGRTPLVLVGYARVSARAPVLINMFPPIAADCSTSGEV
jgi:hypothetical protein